MKIKFIKDGESSNFGVFEKDQIKDLDKDQAEILIKRQLAVAVKEKGKDGKK